MVASIIKEATENSGLEKMADELLNGIGPRLVGSPKNATGARLGRGPL